MKKNLLQLIRKSMYYSIAGFILQVFLLNTLLALNTSAQDVKSVREVYINIEFYNVNPFKAFELIESKTNYVFAFERESIDPNIRINFKARNKSIAEVLIEISKVSNLKFRQVNNSIDVKKLTRNLKKNESRVEVFSQGRAVSGKVVGEDKDGLPGVNVVEKGTTNGTVTDLNGEYNLTVSQNATLVFSSVGYTLEEIKIGNRTVINLSMSPDIKQLQELVVVGYGTQEKQDVTGAIYEADLESFRQAPNTSILQSLQGSVPGLTVGQTTVAGEEPDLLLRGKSTIAGSNRPLIVLDGIIYRGNMQDINPTNIESVNVLKDASAAAIYGAQASNGVIIITSKKGEGLDGKPVLSYSSFYAMESPVRELAPPDVEGFIQQTAESDIFFSRTQASGYLEPDPAWDIATRFSDNGEVDAYNQGRSSNWYDLITNDNMNTQQHNLSLANSTENSNYRISLGYLDKKGYMLNEGFQRLSARINIDNTITDWLQVGVHSFGTWSDLSGAVPNLNDRYLEPFATDMDAAGERKRDVLAGAINPLLRAASEDLDKRLHLFTKIYAQVDVPFIKGLSYKIRFGNNYRRTRQYRFDSFGNGFTGSGSKEINFFNNWSLDNILNYKHVFGEKHEIDLTLVYGREELATDNTRAAASDFVNDVLGYNNLGIGNSILQEANSSAEDESSLYNMARIFYGFDNKYLVTATIRRDGFSGFGENNKFGIFPSLSLAWNATEEAFISNGLPWLNNLKVRASYGVSGNRTIGRFQTLARVEGGFSYIDINNNPRFTQSFASFESPNLKWEKTTGVNFGIDYAVLNQRISGSIDYYNNNTTDLFQQVDIPAINRFTTFPDNLGKLHNEGLELLLTTMNMNNQDFNWTTTFNFSRNRNELKELLGFDTDGDGVEDDLVSEGLFIGESIDAVFDYQIDGKWQLEDEIESGFDVGAHRPVDLDGDGVITPNDRTIIGNSAPSFTFGIQNSMRFKDWTFSFFINSMQGGDNWYLGEDNYIESFAALNSEMHFRAVFPADIDYWTPENPNGRYQRPGINVSGGLRGELYAPRTFTRLQDVSLAYNLPGKLTDQLGLVNLKLYVSGKNLVTLTDWNGWDPETNQTITRNGRPVIKSYTLGIDVQF